MISVNDFRTGLTIELDGEIYTVVEFLHVKPGKGAAFVRTKLKNIRTGYVVEKTFNAGEKVAPARIETRQMQYLYKSDPDYVFMDMETYEQLTLDEEKLGHAKPNAFVMHPGPMNRGVEIESGIADHKTRSLITEQVEMGVAVRMAVLETLAKNAPEIGAKNR